MAATAESAQAPPSDQQNRHTDTSSRRPRGSRPRGNTRGGSTRSAAHAAGQLDTNLADASSKSLEQEGTTLANSEPSEPRPMHATPAKTRARRPRGGALALRPASVVPTDAGPQDVSGPRAPLDTTNHGERSRASRSRGGSSRRGQTHIVHGRQFGGALTAPDEGLENTNAQSGSLQADAPVFVPGIPLQNAEIGSSSRQPKLKPGQSPAPPIQNTKQHPRKRRLSKSVAPDLPTRIHEDIDRSLYECPICTSEVTRGSKIWSCHKCWTVFHLPCINKWASNDEAVRNSQATAQNDSQSIRLWRCPGCNLPQETKPGSYQCWCGKEPDPRGIAGGPPHSCNQTCANPHTVPKGCPHPCELICHAGPCPPCTRMGPTQTCFCGKQSRTKRCVETDYDLGGFTCGQICGDVMPCGEHSCPRPCHEGLCGACEVRIPAKCYCGKDEKDIICADRNDEETCSRVYVGDDGARVQEEWTGIFECPELCERLFDCEIHKCQKPCHASTSLNAHCPFSPDVVTHCPCGKTKISELITEPRQICSDPIPDCERVCLKRLPCGHPCQQTCHTGECMPCLKSISINCRCGKTSINTICHQGKEEQPQCMRTCHTTLNCGRHECGERCCSGERKAIERQATKRKLRPLTSLQRPFEPEFEPEHICTRICGRDLKCGNHTCQELCHKGPCGSCREAVFHEISCHCGKTVLQPPLPCGTGAPACRFDCERPRPCGHPQVSHNCHPDTEPCPKCPFLTEKVCLCSKKTLKNQQCWFSDVRCGSICGKKLRCGSHTCRKTCHKPGECEDASGACTQPCGKPKRSCQHPCEEPCHAPYPCREEKPCPHKIFITCDCQHLKQEARCNASKGSEGNTTKTLKCGDECARLERNRKLALALDIDPAHTDEHIPYSTETLHLYQENIKWAQDQEREFRVFAAAPDEKRLRFKPMPGGQRAFLHALAEDFGLDSESMDPEPHRHVAVFKTPRFVAAPFKTLRDCVEIRQVRMRADAAAAAASAAAKTRSSTSLDPFNGYLLTHARFALTIDELADEIRAVQGPAPKLAFSAHFLGDESVALVAQGMGALASERAVDGALKTLKMPLERAVKAQGFGRALVLARFDDALNVLQRDGGADGVGAGGWSQVAARGAAPARAPQPLQIGDKSSFTVLESLAAKKKKTGSDGLKKRPKRKESVVEDWEAAQAAEDEAEARAEKELLGAQGLDGIEDVDVEGPSGGSELEGAEGTESEGVEYESAPASPSAVAGLEDETPGAAAVEAAAHDAGADTADSHEQEQQGEHITSS